MYTYCKNYYTKSFFSIVTMKNQVPRILNTSSFSKNQQQDHRPQHQWLHSHIYWDLHQIPHFLNYDESFKLNFCKDLRPFKPFQRVLKPLGVIWEILLESINGPANFLNTLENRYGSFVNLYAFSEKLQFRGILYHQQNP